MSVDRKEVKIVYIDGNLHRGSVRCIRGKIINETESMITIVRKDGIMRIGKNFLVKIEEWGSEEGYNGVER